MPKLPRDIADTHHGRASHRFGRDIKPMQPKRFLAAVALGIGCAGLSAGNGIACEWYALLVCKLDELSTASAKVADGRTTAERVRRLPAIRRSKRAKSPSLRTAPQASASLSPLRRSVANEPVDPRPVPAQANSLTPPAKPAAEFEQKLLEYGYKLLAGRAWGLADMSSTNSEPAGP